MDCNNFFVSCERIFRPDLANKPVVVMSSNDGCAVARSNEVKALGIPMGAPMFKYKELIAKNSITTFSANFNLYGDISRRITEYLASKTPIIEVYSIDESFLDITDLKGINQINWATNIRKEINSLIGVPVSIGLGPTKTLAKIASELAKKSSGVEIIEPRSEKLKEVKIEDIWGVGRKYAPKLRSQGFDSAFDIASSSRTKIRNILGSVQGERLFLELNGVACYLIDSSTKPQKMISSTRTFGQDSNTSADIESALANLCSRACFRLRQDKQLAQKVTIFVTSNRNKQNYKKSSVSARLASASSSTGQIISIANDLFSSIYSNRIMYHRAGVILSELVPENTTNQISLTEKGQKDIQQRKNALMSDVDQLNKRFGKNKVHYLSQDLSRAWIPRKTGVSPSYLTNWDDLPKLR